MNFHLTYGVLIGFLLAILIGVGYMFVNVRKVVLQHDATLAQVVQFLNTQFPPKQNEPSK